MPRRGCAIRHLWRAIGRIDLSSAVRSCRDSSVGRLRLYRKRRRRFAPLPTLPHAEVGVLQGTSEARGVEQVLGGEVARELFAQLRKPPRLTRQGERQRLVFLQV